MESKRLILREYNINDFNDLKAIISDDETMKYYDKPYDDDGVRRWLNWNFDNYKTLGFGLWAIELKENGKMIGDCGITMQIIEGKIRPEIGYHINKAYWRRGYAKEACKLVKDWAFTNTTFNELYSYMNYDNVASFSTAKSNGMKEISDYVDKNGEHLRVYMITRKEWEKENDK